ncbi:MAG: hypothetical protein JJE46_02330 [Acidimicrobiia bacterium]|nr:hypothetical protein [Acidimicrobiia bacterium]
MKTHSLRRIIGTGLTTAALCAAAVGVAGPAGAATDGSSNRPHPGRHLTAEQKQCLSDQGITRPIRPLTPEKVAQLKEAAKTCDIKVPHRRHPGAKLTTEQKQCLSDQGITRPIRPLTPEKVAQLKEAAQACGIARPGSGATAQG